MPFTLPDLPFPSNALEPHIDARTMEIHHDKHHGGYVSKLNAAIKGTNLETKPIDEILSNLNAVPEKIRNGVRNNGGGHFNHSLFWNTLGPDKGGEPSGELARAIDTSFGSFDAFKEKFTNAALTRFGSGWAWLSIKEDGTLCVCSSPNQDNPLMKGIVECEGSPILGLDVWEHAYYLNYQNRRPDYISAFWNIVNWDAVAANFADAKSAVAV